MRASKDTARAVWAILILSGTWTAVRSQTAPAQFRIAPEPAWVESLPFEAEEAPPGSPENGGVHYLLIDDQLSGEVQTYFGRRIKKILTEDGVQNESHLQFGFDPSYQEFILHSIRIHRGGNIIDRLDPEKINVIQRERDLERHIYDGALSAVTFLDDVRVGDIIDYSFSFRGWNPIFGGRYVGSFSIRWSIPVKRQRLRIIWPEDRVLHMKEHGSEARPSISEKPPFREYLWEFADLPALLAEGD